VDRAAGGCHQAGRHPGHGGLAGPVGPEQGFAILLVEHDVEFVAGFTERSYVLDFGSMIASGPTPDVLASPEVRRAYLGDLEEATA